MMDGWIFCEFVNFGTQKLCLNKDNNKLNVFISLQMGQIPNASLFITYAVYREYSIRPFFILSSVVYPSDQHLGFRHRINLIVKLLAYLRFIEVRWHTDTF